MGMAAVASNPLRSVPITRWWRYLLAWVAALLLHALLLVILMDWQPILAPPPETRHSLDVLLVSQPEQEPSIIEPTTEIDRPAPIVEHSDRSTARVDEVETPLAPVPQPQPESQPETANEPKAEPQASPEANSSLPAANEPSGAALLAQATDSVRQQGFDAPSAHDGGAPDKARQAAQARYIDAWTRRVEEYGNRHYPAPSHLDGQLRIRVVIGRDGQLLQAEVIQSSGHPELDQAALQALHGAAPYRPFDRGMGARDSLTVTRNWRFGKGHNFGVR